ncbi:helix-turn-helix domain-containing protein [Enterococcus faecium]|uniref:helix-turn-helix domain-containing protein n=1 Tax=Enterococcus faecium TaxID=1352 RepID=UPI0019EEFEB1|nr:helix-turn-helix domain-containing protein [Enterococcus faecium]HAQ7942436.1 helix-turn-helix domain-containing protein [Enterococcus faecium]HDT7940958.1 helix-turn-helix domain-containing protein [Enterococcus faecium]
MDHRSYYAIIPANVRYDDSLIPSAKLLYGEITALCNEKGYCWASNEYFANQYKVSKPTIQNWLKSLEEKGYIYREVKYKVGSKEIEARYIRILGGGHQENLVGGHQEIYQDNNTSINNTFNNTKEYIRELPPSKKSKAKPIRHKYGEYKNVLLSDEQMEKLKTEFPNDYQERIERLSEYCESSGKTYKNYLATIRSWARKEKSESKNASSGYKRTGRREKLPEWAIDQEAYLKKKALERANRQSKAPF